MSYLDEAHSQYLDVIEGEIEGYNSFRSIDSPFYSIEAKGTHEEVVSDKMEIKQAGKELFHGLQAMILLKRMSEQDPNVPSETIDLVTYATGAVLGTERSVVDAKNKIFQLWSLVKEDPLLSGKILSFIEGYNPSRFDNTPVVTEELQNFLLSNI